MPSTPFWLNAMMLAATTLALPSKRQSDNTLSMDVVAVNRAQAAGTVDAPFTDQADTTLFVKLTLGSDVIWSNLDTGSSSLVVFDKAQLANAGKACPFTKNADGTDNAMCALRTYNGQGTHVASEGNTIKTTEYGDGDKVSGSYYTDTLSFNGADVQNFEFFKGTTGNTLDASVFGTGLQANERSEVPYDNLPLALTTANKINAPIFSLWINSYTSSKRGSMLYGGVDNKKFCGTLGKTPITSTTEVSVNVPSASIVIDGGATTPLLVGNTNWLLDTGSSSIYLPTAAFQQATIQFGGALPTTGRDSRVNCNLRNGNSALTFNFNGATVSVPAIELIIDDPDSNNRCGWFVRDQATDREPILGARFLASAYVVYDFLNFQVYIAQAITDATSSNVVAVTNSANPIPSDSLSGAPCGSTSSSTTSSSSTMSSTSTSASMATSSSASSSTSTESSTSSSITSPGSSSSSMTTSSASSSGTVSGSSSSVPASSGMSTSSATSSTGSSSSSGSTSMSGSSSSTTATGKASSTASSSSNTATGTNKASSTMTSSVTGSTYTNTWSNWVVPTSSKKTSSSSTTWHDPKITSVWNNWNGAQSLGSPTSKTTPKITSTATWSAWTSAQSITYSTVTTTIYVCPASNKNCAASAKTKTVTVTVVPYTASTVYTTKTITVTASCPAGSDCNGSYYTTTVTVVPLSTTVVPYTPAASTDAYTWSGVSGASSASPASWSGASSASPASWTGVSSASPASWSASGSPTASSWSGVNTPAASSTSWVAVYQGAASSSYGATRAMALIIAVVASAIFMLL